MGRIGPRKATQILRAGNAPTSFRYASLVMGVLGGGRIWTQSVHPEPSPGDPLGTFPSLGKYLAPQGETLCGGETPRLNGDETGGPVCRPYSGNRTMSVGSGNRGAGVEPHQRQFLQTQGPVARKESRKATQILRAGNIARPDRYASPVMGSGESSPMDLGGAKRSRSPSAASPDPITGDAYLLDFTAFPARKI